MGWATAFRFPAWAKIFLFATASSPALGPTEALIKCVPGVKRPGRGDDTHLHSVSRLRIHGTIPSLFYAFLWRPV